MDAFNELRDLLLSEEQRRLTQLSGRLDDPAQRSQDVAAVLPSALRQLNAQAETAAPLAAALQQPVDACLQQTLQDNPRSVAQPLLKVMTPPLRQVVADAFKSLREYIRIQQTQTQTLTERLDTLEQQRLGGLLSRLDQQEARLLARLEVLEASLNDPTQRTLELARLLPEAIRQANESASQPATDAEESTALAIEPRQELSEALRAPLEHSLRDSISQDPHILANALFPVMGPAIRKAINEAIKGLVQHINRTLEQGLSARGLAWRIEALRTGRPYTQVVLQHTIVFRIEQVFLIHRDSGLLIQHVYQENIEVGDSDAVSGMLTAIQDFIRDSFSTTKQEELDSVDMGDYTVWLERGPYAVLACVIRGMAPYGFRGTMRGILETLHARYGRALQAFEGDATTLAPARPLLEKALKTEEKAEEFTDHRWRRRLLWGGAALGLLTWLAHDQWQAYQQNQRVTAYLQTLNHTPGLVITEFKHRRDYLRIQGLRDPLAADPAQLAQPFDLSDLELTSDWRPYQDLSPQFVSQRLQQQAALWLNPPDTVTVDWQGTALTLRGHADQAWIERVRNQAALLPGLSALHSEALLDNNAYWQKTQGEFAALLKKLNATPGIIVVSSGIDSDKQQRFIQGMRDPLADDPSVLAAGFGIQDIQMQWRAYQDLTPVFVEKRARQWLAPLPSSVQLKLDGTRLILSGHADPSWIEKARGVSIAGVADVDSQALLTTDAFLQGQATRALQPPPSVTLSVQQGVLRLAGAVALPELRRLTAAAAQLPGFSRVDGQALVDKDAATRQRLRETIENTVCYFSDKQALMPGQTDKMNRLRQALVQLLALNPGLEAPLSLEIIGHTDGLGSQAQNRELSETRAQVVRALLLASESDSAATALSANLRIAFPPRIRFGEQTPEPHERKVVFRIRADAATKEQ